MTKNRRILSLTITAVAALLAVAFGAVAPAAASGGPTLESVTLTISHATIYPHVDGYRDSLQITLAKHVTGTSGSIPLTGQVQVSRAGKTVAAYPITTSTTETYVWNGRVKDKIVAGTYTVSAKVTGPDGTITKHASVSVSHKELVSVKSVKTYTAQEFFQHSYTAKTTNKGCSTTSGGSVACISASGKPAVGSNYVSVPKSVLLYAGYSPYTAKVAVSVSGVKVVKGSDTYWDWNGEHTYSFVDDGTHTTGTSSFGSTTVHQHVAFRVGGGSAARFDKVTITYVYSELN